jgi:opacity protein-like surface antigen
MHVGRSIVLVPVFALVIATSAMGQQLVPQSGSAAVPEQRGYIAALAGAVSGPPTEPVFAVEYGENMHPDVQAYVTLSYFENVMPRDVRSELAVLGTTLSGLTGTSWSLTGRDRAVTATAGAKYLIGRRAVRPYIGAGAGIINIKRTIVEARIGEITTAVFNDFEIGQPDLSLESAGVTRPLGEAAVGVGIVAGHTYVDVGYRYRRAFRLATTLDLAQFTVGVGYKF